MKVAHLEAPPAPPLPHSGPGKTLVRGQVRGRLSSGLPRIPFS